MKKITIILFATLGIIFLTACEKKDTKGPIRIASIEPLSGPYASVGKDLVDALKFWAEITNKNGGVLDGRMIEIVPMDNAMKAEKTTELLLTLEDYNNCQRFGLMLEFAPDGKIIEFSWENS